MKFHWEGQIVNTESQDSEIVERKGCLQVVEPSKGEGKEKEKKDSTS